MQQNPQFSLPKTPSELVMMNEQLQLFSRIIWLLARRTTWLLKKPGKVVVDLKQLDRFWQLTVDPETVSGAGSVVGSKPTKFTVIADTLPRPTAEEIREAADFLIGTNKTINEAIKAFNLQGHPTVIFSLLSEHLARLDGKWIDAALADLSPKPPENALRQENKPKPGPNGGTPQ